MRNSSLQVNEAQSKAITHGAGPMLVLAGPGSGKTFVITQRILFLIEELHIRPEQILVITFTKAAALEMQKRFRELSHKQTYSVSFGTFHSVFFQILKQAYGFQASSILRESDKIKFLKEIVPSISSDIINTPEILQKLLSEISKVKNLGIAVCDYQSECCSKEEFQALYQSYTKRITQEHKVDFDDMVLLCHSLLQKRPDLLKIWQERFPYILIDEFQDINPPQYETVRLLAAPGNNLFVVGDDDQAIYGFRGSNPKIMLNFEQDYPNAKRVLLNINYRSNQDILQAAQNVIKHNKIRFSKDVTAFHQESNSVKLFSFPTRQAQSQNIISLIQQYKKQPNTHYRDIALIYRTNTNALMTAEKLMQAKIPFQMKEKSRCIYDTEIAKDMLAYLEYALYEKNVAAFYRIMNRPVRYIPRNAVPVSAFSKQDLIKNVSDKNYVLHNVVTLYEHFSFIRQLSPYAAINFIRKGMGYEKDLLEKEKESGKQTGDALSILNDLQESAKGFDTIAEWLTHIQNFKEEMTQSQNKQIDTTDAIHIVTMHASKGLEWPVVIIPDINEGVTPHKKASNEAELEEERRMFYVALTRAKKSLFLFYVKEKEAGTILPSRFISELTSKPFKKPN